VREVRVVHSTKPLKKISTEADSWGQLKDSLLGYGNFDELNVVVRETKNALVLDDSVLPEGDFTIILSPKKVKAGGNDVLTSVLESLKEKISDAIDEIIEEIEDGDHGDDDEDEDDLDDEDKECLLEVSKLR